MYNLCNKFFDDPQDIVTAVNNGMLRVFKYINQYEADKADFFNWVYSIVRNSALTHVRDKSRNPAVAELAGEFEAETTYNPFKEKAESDVFVYLGKLTATTRAVCSLFYIEEYSVKEIAASLAMKEGTVKWHLNEGRNRLKMIFNSGGINTIANAI